MRQSTKIDVFHAYNTRIPPCRCKVLCALVSNFTGKFGLDQRIDRVDGQSDYISPVRRTKFGTTIGMSMLDNTIFMPPASVYSNALKYDNNFLTALGHVLNCSEDDKLRSDTLPALEWFYLAHTDSDLISPKSEVVMMATAFEGLLGLSRFYRDKKKEELINAIDSLFLTNKRILQKAKDRGGTEREYSWKQWWMDEFYLLRNRIAHGKTVTEKNLIWSNNVWFHLEIADILFRNCIKKLLVKDNLYNEKKEDIAEANAIDQFLSTPGNSFYEIVQKELWNLFCAVDNSHLSI
jgi:hypothetical protein